MKCENKFVVFGLALVLGFSLSSCNTQPNDSSSSNNKNSRNKNNDDDFYPMGDEDTPF